VPIGLLGIVLATLYIGNQSPGQRRPLDWIGFLLTGIALTCLTFGIENIGKLGDPVLGWSFIAGGLAIGVLSVLHAKRHPSPLIDFSLLRIPTFSANFWGGFLFRLSTATPFLLPLMFQVGFGLSAFNSGLLTFTTAVGSMTMKMTAVPVIRRFGFRNVLIWNGILCAGTLMACGMLTPSMSTTAIVAVLLIGGVFRSLQFNTLQTVAYAEIPPAQMSAATTIGSMVQQLGNGFGVAIAALLLQAALAWRGTIEPDTADFQFAFAAVALVSLSSIAFYIPLARDAGDEVSGHQARKQPAGD
jgi:hypothetical protein